MGGEPVTVVWAVVAGVLALGAMARFGLFRHRDNELVWASAGTGGGAAAETGGSTDPVIARRIASLLHEDAAPPVAAEPVPEAEADLEPRAIPRAAPGTLLAASDVDVPAAPDAAASGESASGEPEDLKPVEPRVVADDPSEMLRRLLVDHVTGLGSRLAWDRWVADEEARERRYRRPTTLVVAEVTGLDGVSAFLGSDTAVRVVTEIADIVRANVRTSDHAALVGPARFAMMLPETDEVRAVNFVERVRAACDRWLQANAPTVGIGFGWASPGASSDLATARELADRRLAADLRDVSGGPSRT